MQIEFCPEKAASSSHELLELSRAVGQCRESVEDARYQLQHLTGLGECRSAFLRQEESLALLAARIAGLSASLEEITALYCKAESNNLDGLNGHLRPYQGTGRAGSNRHGET